MSKKSRSSLQVTTDEKIEYMVDYLVKFEGHDNVPSLIRYLIRNRFMQHTRRAEIPNKDLIDSIESAEKDYSKGNVTSGNDRVDTILKSMKNEKVSVDRNFQIQKKL